MEKKEKQSRKQHSKRLSIYDLKGKSVGNLELDEALFDGHVNKALLYEVEKMYEANVRRGTASTKRRGEVSGGGIKPWRQKGTGRARVGSIRSPLWRHGGIIFGPHPRDFRYTLPEKVRKGALLSSLNARLLEEGVKAIKKIELDKIKTKEFNNILKALKVEGKTLVVVDKLSREVKLSSRNLENVTVKEAKDINARDVLLNGNLVIESEAFEKITGNLKCIPHTT